MSRFIEFNRGDEENSVILVEANENFPVDGPVQVSVRGVMAQKANEAFDAALAGVTPIASAVIQRLKEAVTDAGEFEVEFGVTLTAEAGVILARTAAEGHCKISIKWTAPKF
jgi:hypothetical protein